MNTEEANKAIPLILKDEALSANAKEKNRRDGYAAILEHFYEAGSSVIDDSSYYSDQMVFYKLLDALTKVFSNRR